ncbi:hypothetical protein MKW92_046809 [Papaver armeniacum]|nr:hypothetical protein MKW92_046809 [Papaver armeniacum]
MASTSTVSLSTHPKIGFHPFARKKGFDNSILITSSSGYSAQLVVFPQPSISFNRKKRFARLVNLVPRASSSSSTGGTGGRRVYKQSQAEPALSSVRVKEAVSMIIPAGVFVVVTFVLVPKQGNTASLAPSSGKSKFSLPGIKWSFAPGTNMSSGLSFTDETDRRMKKQMLNDFAKELKSFRSVNMSGLRFGDDGLFFLAESLAYNQIAEEVDFSANDITAAGLKAFDGVLQSNIVLKTLNLSGNLIGDEGAKCLCDILLGNNSIQKLQLNSANVGDEGAKAIAELLKKNTSLRAIELNNNLIDYSGFTSLAGALPENNTIQSIHLNGNYGGALGAAALAKGIEGNKSLRELHVHGNAIGNEGVRALMTGLSAHRGKITLLDISNNEIGPKGAYHVAEYIKKSKNLLWLNLYMNDISDEGAEKVADALKQNRSLTAIDLALAEVLKFHGKIEILKLGWCQIGVKGAEYIADALKYNTTISTLDLRANGLGDDGAACLARSLKVVNEALTSLDLGFNEIRDKGAFAIAQALKSNGDITITSMNFASNFLTKLGQVALTDARDHVYEMTEKEVNIFF